MNELPDGWAQFPLGDVVDVLDSRRVPVNADEREKRKGSIPYYGATGQVGWIDRPLFNEELLLLGEDGAPFLDPRKPKAYMISGPSWVNNHAHVLRAIDGRTSNRYLLHYLNWLDYNGRVTGTTRLKLTQRALRSLPVRLAPVEEQQRIVEVIEELFSRLDSGVESFQRAKRNLSRLRASTLRSLFDPEWPMIQLGVVAKVVGGLTKDSRRESAPDAVEIPYLRVANVQRGYLDLLEVKTIRAPLAKINAFLLQPGDVLLTEGGDRDKLGRGWVWRGEVARCIHQNHIFRARLDADSFVPEFVSTYSNRFGQQWFEQMGKQTTNLASISLSNLRKFPIPCPPLATQVRVMAEIDRQNSILDAIDATLAGAFERSGSLHRSILSEAFAGRLAPAQCHQILVRSAGSSGEASANA